MLGGSLPFAAVFPLPFPDHVHEFSAGEKDADAAKMFEAEHRPGSTFDGAAVLLGDVVQVLADDDRLPAPGVDGFEGGHIRAALIDRHFPGGTVPLDSLFEKAARRDLVATRPQQEIDGVACLVDGPVEILPLSAQTKS